jgi:hypothetical protein
VNVDVTVDMCQADPTIAACATAAPTFNPAWGSPVPNGIADCALDDDTQKPGMRPFPGNVVGDALVWTNNAAVGALVPGECVGGMVTEFADGLASHQPFAFFYDAKGALDAAVEGVGPPVEIPTWQVMGAEIDIAPAFVMVGDALDPFGAVLRLIPWLLGLIIVLRKVMGTVGAGEGGG